MKTTIVPAQVTTVEDKIAGNLSFTQLLLLVTPVFIDAAIFVLLPPVFNYSLPKLVVGICIALLFMTLATRIKGKILLQWIAIIARYRLRAQYYLFNKNERYLRHEPLTIDTEPARQIEKVRADEATKLLHQLKPNSNLVRIQHALDDPRANFHLKFGKGGLRVHIREVKEESI